MKKTIHRILFVLLWLVAAAALVAEISMFVCSCAFRTGEYTVAIEGIRTETTVVLISDLHGGQFGRDNARLTKAIAAQNPDAIFIAGDMVNKDCGDDEVVRAVELVAQLQDIAQVYYSPGNTELDNMRSGGADVLRLVRGAGAVAMLDDYVETRIGGNRVNVGFTMGHYRYTQAQWADPPDYAMEYAVGADGTPAIVLMHMPESLFLDIHDKWTGDLYLSGHTHGGLWQLPFAGGVFAPTQGLWPEYDRGYYTFDDGRFQMIISPGLAGYKWVPRLFNMPEISVIHITPA